jgi:hypothetical protein
MDWSVELINLKSGTLAPATAKLSMITEKRGNLDEPSVAA